jgi:hypothetical protein
MMQIFCISLLEAPQVKTLFAAAILTLTLAVTALAGQIQCPGAASSESTPTTDITTAVVLTVVSVTY